MSVTILKTGFKIEIILIKRFGPTHHQLIKTKPGLVITNLILRMSLVLT